MASPTRASLLGLAGWLAVTFAAAAVGAIASMDAGAFYGELVRPAWAPPASIFGPMWSVLYLLMGIAAWLVWRAGGWAAARVPLTLFVVQLVLNSLWSWLFFGWHLGALSFIDIVLLWVLLVATLVTFWRVRVLAAVLLVPYLLWVSYAAALNHAVWRLNPALLG